MTDTEPDNGEGPAVAFVLFGDQSPDSHGSLAAICRQEVKGILAKVFLEQVGDALGKEIDRLSSVDRTRIPEFRTLQQLNERYHNQLQKHSGLDAALLCASQLAHYIDHCERNHEYITSHDRTFLVGLCTGLFAAFAIAITHSLSALVPIGVQAVLLAFRTGTYVDTVGQRLSPTVGSSRSWTHIYPSVQGEDAVAKLAEFQDARNTPSASRAYVSAESVGGLGISGPPSSLAALVNEDLFSVVPMTNIPIFAPYHARHLHADADIDEILRLGDPEVQDSFYRTRRRSPILSCSTGQRYSTTDSKTLLKSIVHDILNERLRFTKVMDGCLECAEPFNGQTCLILPVGPTQNAETLDSCFRSRTSCIVTLHEGLGVPPESIACSIGNHGSKGKPKLAIVGMSGRFPDAASHEKLWELLEKGLDVHRVVPPDRFDVKTHYDPLQNAWNTSRTPYGCWIENPGMFDPRFFSMSPREALQTDPMQRLAMVTAYEALEMSGYAPNRTPSTRLDRIGTFYGQTSDDWREINAAQEVDTYFITGGVRAFGPGRINYHLGFSGPSLNIDTACSSSAAALQVACTALWARDCDTAIVGGLSCMTNPDIFAGLSRGQFLSPTGPCATFDDAADGYCRGDACASVIVKRLEDALADQDNVLAVILGTATNHSADAVSITHPHGPTQSTLSTAILDEAGVDPHDIDYVEMHGTGTQAGDGTEMVSVTNVFAPANRKRPRDRPLYLGAVKANVGHGEAASGVTALIKVIMMLQKNAIPPHVGIKPGSVMNRTFPTDLSERNVNIAFHLTPFRRRDGKPRRVFVNNFSAAGGNTGLLLEDPPKPDPATKDPRSHHIVTVTGKSKFALIGNAKRLVAWIEENPHTPMSHLAYSTTARRIQHHWRMSVSGAGVDEVKRAVAERLKDNFVPIRPQQPKLVFTFTGQGSHYPGLGKELYELQPVFRKSIREFDRLARAHGFPSFLPLIDGSEPDLSRMPALMTQLGLCCFEMALAQLWMSWGVMPAAVVGHSLGEYAALQVAGVLSASDAIYLVGTRAQLLVDKCTEGTHSMLAIETEGRNVMESLSAEVASIFNVACINSPAQTVLSGNAAEMVEVSRLLSGNGFKSKALSIPFAFHSSQVEPILDPFEELARGVNFNAPQLPILSPLLGKLIEGEAIDAHYLRRHAREPVNLLAALVSAQQSGAIDEKTVWLEIGPSPTVTNFVKSAFGTATVAVHSLRRGALCYKTISDSLCTLHTAGVKINFNDYHRDFRSSVRLVELPRYTFQEKDHWLQYTGDWCLTKNRIAAAPVAEVEPPKPKLSTTTVQKVIREEITDDVAIVEIESDLCQAELRKAVSGHLVNGAPLCPSSLYGDMAMTVCEYAYKLLRPDTESIGCNVAHMEVPKTLIFNDTAESHILRLTVTANAKLGHADLVFHTGEGAKRTDHAMCKVYYGKLDDWQVEFDRVAYLIKARIDALKEAEQRGTASKIGRGLAYKLFAALVDYNPRYRGMEEVILDSDTCEATAKIRFQTTEEDGTFRFSPYHIDSVCHISGFIINGTDAVDSREQVFISHGWGSMRFTEIPQAGKEYRSYIRMQEVRGTKMMAGDAYVFDGDKVIGIAGDIRFQAIPRKVLNMLLPPRGAAAAAATTAAPAAKTAAPAAKTAPKAAQKSGSPKTKKKETVTPHNIGKVNQKLKSVISEVMNILAKEVGCGHDELADNIAFTDLGVDSLMTLTVSGRIREDLDVDIHSNAFVDYPTIGAFKGYLSQFEKPGRKESISSHDSDVSSDESPEIESDSNVTTPLDESEDGSVKGDEPSNDLADASSRQLQSIIRDAIAKEMGVDVDEIIATPDLASLGMDSLMSLTICGTLREKTGKEIPSDLFVANPSLRDVERALGVVDAPKRSAAPKQTKQRQAAPPVVHPKIGLEEPAPPKPPRPTNIVDDYPHRNASSVLLAGSQRAATKNLFMVPDGSGSATSYTEIADVGPDWAVWGLFSPYMKTPEEYKCGVYGMATKFIEEMKRRQPEGPYSLSGWSAGGVIAYEIVFQLTKAGEEVEHLLIIDAPCPVTIEPLPEGLHAWFASIGLLGDGDEKKIPSWLLPHFAASITALSNYDAEPIPKDKCPRVTTIWCENGVCNLPSDPRPEPYPKGHALFLLDNRSDFGPNRWDEYLDKDKMEFKHMPGNHFSMMHGDLAKQLNGFMKEALNSA